ncbi:MAG: flagellar export protein FliJ [Gammaproteobacteria bacterium]|jgi:flagellar FliJ protein|nr:flagellar export protein FliJ [Gammaproteobacteria bacterium]MBT3722619.1 flagellar export protein FliJ [Gammaproteobacteria bacterium]MBT4193061.1 flagellar export protein FliJ [Gammaproteobacteria bacterium]MBT4451470.1 flagellar export protein FliJ [Gammaproteobacteria bacterium]MBT4861442.1 flagellar export protein FliJ [Gammaproteobacteria bacterium]
MTRSKKLQPVVKHVDKNEQSALKAVAISQQLLQQHLNQLQQLKDYKNEYANKHSSEKGVSYSALQLQEFNRFLNQLSDTISQQQQIVAMAQREVDLKRQSWKVTRSRSDAMHKMVDRMQASELQKAEKIEQKYMDEVALRISLKTT